MRIQKLLIFFIVIFFAPRSFAQNEWSNWYFSRNSAITFPNRNLPQANIDFVNNNQAPESFYWSMYGGISYSDPVTGTMKFILSGRYAYDKNYNMIPQSNYLRVCPGDVDAFHIIPFSNDPNKFYIIQYQDLLADLLAQGGLQVRCPNAIGLGYSVLDLSLRGGLGDFTSMNTVLTSSVPQGICLIRHSNGKDTWVVVHGWNNNNFMAYLFTDNGVTGPVISSAGPVLSQSTNYFGGTFTASHAGDRIATQMTNTPDLYLFDFDNSTGRITGSKTINTTVLVHTQVFSPDDSKLYFLNYEQIFQLDLDAPPGEAPVTMIADETYQNIYDMQLGLDGRIYLAGKQQWDSYHTQFTMPVINCPNLAKWACNYDPVGFKLPLDHEYNNFPHFVNDYIKQPKAPRATEFSLGNDTAICFGSYKLSAPDNWQHYRWNTGETTREITVSHPGLYYVLAGDLGFSCPSAYGSITLTNAAKPLNLGKDTTLCPNLPYMLSVDPGFTDLVWSDGTDMHDKPITVGGKYTLVAKDEKGCTNWDTVSVYFKSDPRASFGKDTTLCSDQTLLLQLEPRPSYFGQNPVYLWQNGSQKDTFRVKAPGTYWGQVSYQGCTASDTITVGFVSPKDISLGRDTTICIGDSLVLNPSVPNAHCLWSTGETGNQLVVKNSGTYWVRVDNGSCTVADTIQVNVQPRPVFSLGRDTTLCAGDKLVLAPSLSNASFAWQDGSTASSFAVMNAGSYWSKATVNGCASADTIVIAYNARPTVNLGSDTSICAGETLVLKATDPSIASYTWNNGSTQSSLTVANNGSFWVRAVSFNGCSNSDTVKVTVVPLPNFSLGRDTVLCEGSSLPLSYSLPGATYYWSSGTTSNAFTITRPGLYWLSLSQNGCTKTDSLVVNYKPLPRVSLGRDTVLCQGNQLHLDATNANATYLWQDGTTTPVYNAVKAGSYRVLVDLDGCKKADTVVVNFIDKPVFSLGRDTSLCEGMELRLDPRIGNASYLWQDGSTAPFYIVKTPGIYKLTATNGCGSTAHQVIVEKGVCQLLMPNAFTPNGDGVNDLFRVKYPGFIQSFSMTIYSRWGEIIFQSNDATRGWDGTYRGVPQKAGNYIWKINLTTKQGEKMSAVGSVMLIR